MPCAPAIPTWRTAPGASRARCRAVAAAASTGPTPHTRPGRSQSSMSVAATRRTLCFPTSGSYDRSGSSGRRDGVAPRRAKPREVSRDSPSKNGPRDPEEPVVLAKHRDRGVRAELLDIQTLARAATPKLDRASRACVPHPVALAVRGDEPALVPFAHDRDRRRPGPAGRTPANREEMRVRPRQTDPRERPDDDVQRPPPEAPAVRLRPPLHGSK